MYVRLAVILLLSNSPSLFLSSKIKVRMLWVRHGQSCANVLDRCQVGQAEAPELLPDIKRALPEYPPFSDARLNISRGLAPASSTEKDCTVGIVQTEAEQIVRLHDLYRDPGLTDCARDQSVQAGLALLRWLDSQGLALHFIGSSFLMRAFETAYAMFVEACTSTQSCERVLNSTRITPLPFITERAPGPSTKPQADNMPRAIQEQLNMLGAMYDGMRLETIDTAHAEAWRGEPQHWAKFAAFLATQIVPQLAGWQHAPLEPFREALRAALPHEMHHSSHGEEVAFGWQGGGYSTGRMFSKREYLQLDVREVNVAIVGHNQMMMEYCQRGLPPKPNNNAILEKMFIVEFERKTNHTILHELGDKCTLLMDAPDALYAMANLVTDDVRACAHGTFDVAKLIGVIDGASTCVRLADDGAHPIEPCSESRSATGFCRRTKPTTVNQ